MGTIGYGAMYPVSLPAHLAVTAESIVSLLVAAVATGLVFSKFAVPTARLEFARSAVFFRLDGVPTLAIRLANTRGRLPRRGAGAGDADAGGDVAGGAFLYKMYDLRLFRDRSPALGRGWQVLHPIGPESPLRGTTAESVRGQDMEITVSVTGIDGTSSQTLHGSHRYLPEDLRFGARFADMLSPKPDGRLQLDYSKLHEVTPASY